MFSPRSFNANFCRQKFLSALFSGLLLSGLVIAPGFAAKAAAADLEVTPTVAVRGEGEIEAVPDEAWLYAEFTFRDDSRQKATDDVNRRLNAALSSLKKSLGAKADIAAENIQVFPEYEKGLLARNFKGYRITRTLRLKIKDLSELGGAYDLLLQQEADRINGPTLGFSNLAELKNQALEKAMQAAKIKADLLARAAGAKVGPALQIREEGVSMPVPQTMRFREQSSIAMMSKSADFDSPVEIGKQTISASVNVEFLLK